MGEYQYYGFLAVDRPLGLAEQRAVRALSSRAEITATTFANEYHWGDFKGDPAELMSRYYDAHVHITDWGDHRVMLRLPDTAVDAAVIDDHRVDDFVDAWVVGGFAVFDFQITDEDREILTHDPGGWLPAIAGIRLELAAGDLRPLYLAWLAAYGTWERNEDAFTPSAENEVEPPVPPGLATLTAPQRALSTLLRLDPTLLATASQPNATPSRRRTVGALLDTTAHRRTRGRAAVIPTAGAGVEGRVAPA
ncbi:hypothetical protein [Actinokineospora terrae]|uniref:Uncharacterized protein n=1 Tax=Actinokineospora terrae TaxID=155974 RepID=A0A1H9WW17_9PSEU|nr:hypothetical protein [Actinokineospora terrae]SES37961.1 hypothetical protein SAMN04487818_111270 [Actinokineospora terrae]